MLCRSLRPALVFGLVALGCGGSVVVDGPGAGGQGGGTSSSSSTSTSSSTSSTSTSCFPTAANPGEVVLSVCVETLPAGGCMQEQIGAVVASLEETCVNDPLCLCAYSLVSAPCPPNDGCCYDVVTMESPTLCE